METQSMTQFWNWVSSDGNSLQNHHHDNISGLSTDGVLRYIDQMLMEEDMDDETHMLQDSSGFQAKERSFYELLGQEYPRPEPPAALVTSPYFDPPLSESEVMSWNFWKGVDEATKFLPSNTLQHMNDMNEAVTRSEINNPPRPHDEFDASVKESDDDTNEAVVTRGEINNPRPHDEFDTWTHVDPVCEELVAYITDLRSASSAQQKERTDKRRSVDLSSLLISCAQAVASDDQRGANECLRQIRVHSSQFGDANQRVAHYMVRGLEARLDGRTGSWMQKTFTYERMSASDHCAIHCTSFISSSFRRISIFASNKLIAVRSKKSERIHIIDFGILYGLQWPALIQHLGQREGGPPKLLRITGIDFPQPGCEAAERIKATGNRLVQYAEMFGVPFEYNAIAQSWESIRVEELGIEEGEFVAVNCLFRAEILKPDEMLVSESPRSKFLDLIRKINPGIFVNAVVNGGYGVPYFMTRFREALFHFSALFDMVETFIPKERPERMVLESMLGNIAMNVIACEGAERVERPESCSQWRLRHLRAGLKQVHFERKLLGSIMSKVRSCYHREFVVVEDNKWLMMSWKGRTICAFSCWKPA